MTNFDLTDEQIQQFAASLVSQTKPDYLKDLATSNMYARYQTDPVGFISDVLGEKLTPDLIALAESFRDNIITVAISCTGTGKSFVAARLAIWFYTCFQQSKVFLSAAPPLENLRNTLFGEIGTVVNRHPDLFSNSVTTTLDIRRAPEEFLTGVTIPSSGTDEERVGKFSGKHQRNMAFILDEGDAIPDCVYTGIDGCMSGGNVHLMILFNPKQSSGAVYRMIRDKTANVVRLSAFNHPNVITGNDVIPGAVTRDVTVRRINEWTRPVVGDKHLSDSSVYIVPDYLVGVVGTNNAGKDYPPLVAGQYEIVDPSFSYKVLGRYPAQGSDQLISGEWISAARSRYDVYIAEHGDKPPVGATGVMGLDVAEMGSDSNVCFGRYGGYLTKPTVWGGVDTVETGDKAIEWYQGHDRITRCNVDATGVGTGVAPHMRRYGDNVIATPIKVASSPKHKSDMGNFRILRDELLWAVREWLKTDQGAMLPPCEELLEELLVPTYDTDTGKVCVMKTSDMKKLLGGKSPDYLMALAMTFANQGGFFNNIDLTPFPD